MSNQYMRDMLASVRLDGDRSKADKVLLNGGVAAISTALDILTDVFGSPDVNHPMCSRIEWYGVNLQGEYVDLFLDKCSSSITTCTKVWWMPMIASRQRVDL